MNDQNDAFIDELFGSEVVDLFHSHVMLYQGFDLSAAGIYDPEVLPCLLCRPRDEDDHPDGGIPPILVDEVLSWGKQIHYVCCGRCGTRGPWGKTETDALSRWNAAFNRAAA